MTKKVVLSVRFRAPLQLPFKNNLKSVINIKVFYADTSVSCRFEDKQVRSSSLKGMD
jgi:hypothetical protein